MFVRLVGVSFSYIDSVPLLSDLNFAFHRGWTGVVGANGNGKTTLLRLVAGQTHPSAGHVQFDPANLAVAFCHQTVEELTPAIASFAVSTDRLSHRLFGEFALCPDDLDRWPTLSPGERKRWQVGAALAAEPNVLMLDEPTDHLDSEARELLLAGLERFQGVGIVVSHDRTLLDRLTPSTVRVHNGTAHIWRGSYSAAKQSWEAEEREYQEAHDRLRAEEKKLRRRLADKRRMVQEAEAHRSRENRKRGLFDGQIAAPARTVAGRTRQDISVLKRASERVAGDLAEFKFHKSPGRSLFVDYVAAPVAKLLTLDEGPLCAGDLPVLAEVHVALGREDRVRIAGPNGIGKTTLLRALMSGAHIPHSRLLYLPQEIAGKDAELLLDEVRAMPHGERTRVLTMVAALGVEPDRLMESSRPSPGEARKLKIACGLGQRVWALVLDEPTNHLDMPAIERLEECLAEYPGALLLVTHDEQLARRSTDTEWRLDSGHIEVTSR